MNTIIYLYIFAKYCIYIYNLKVLIINNTECNIRSNKLYFPSKMYIGIRIGII